ncbi:HD domain-containing protein [Caldiplasma sukawensis]
MNEKFKIIQDPINGPIRVDEKFIPIIDTAQFQRLHWIRQLGMVFYVYPGANHTRFEHSIGTMHLAQLAARSLRMKNENEIMLAALLHDIGHYPFSHSFENLFSLKYGTHEERGKKIIREYLKDVIIDRGFDFDMLMGILEKREEFSAESQIISGSLDVDEMDYLIRDAYHTGVSILPLDPRRIFEIIVETEGNIVVSFKGLTVVESILISRYIMFRSVYFHKTARVIQRMAEYALRNMNHSYEVAYGTDWDLMNKLKEDSNGNNIASRILKRDIYRIVGRASLDGRDPEELKEKIYEKYSEGDEIIVDITPPSEYATPERSKSELTIIDQDGKIREIRELSPLVSSLQNSFAKQYITVFASKRSKNIIEEISKILR